MKKITFILLLSLAIPVMAGPNGDLDKSSIILAGPTAITVGADWFSTSTVPPAFFWSGVVPALSPDGPFTFNHGSMVRVDVTDDFCKGDQFEVFDGAVSIGLTSAVVSEHPGCSSAVGPAAAFVDPTYSSGSFFLPAGAHSINIAAVVNPWSAGRGYIRVMDPRIDVVVDIKPGSCPNPLNPKSKGSVPVAIVGTEDFDVTIIDPDTLTLAGVPIVAGNILYADVTEPHESDPQAEECEDCFDADDPDNWVRAQCDIDGDGDIDDDDYGYCGDGYDDLIVKFDTQALADAIADASGAERNECLELTLEGQTFDGLSIVLGSDEVLVIKAIPSTAP